jgi:hypothetical protein
MNALHKKLSKIYGTHFFMLAVFFFFGESVSAQQTLPTKDVFGLINRDSTAHTYFVVKISDKKIGELKQHNRLRFARRVEDDYYVINKADIKNVATDISVIGAANSIWKMPPGFNAAKIKFPQVFSVRVLDNAEFFRRLKLLKLVIVSQHSQSSTFAIRISNRIQFDKIASADEVVFIKPDAQPHSETPNTFQDISANKINYVQHLFPFLNGEELNVSVKEKNIDSIDIDLRRRVLPSTLADEEVSLHATQIATIIAGAGNSVPSAKGPAWKSFVVPSSYDNLLPDDNDFFLHSGISVQNHSYGTEIENYYGTEAYAYDEAVFANPYVLHVFSSGNSGDKISSDGLYNGVAGYANLTGNMKMAKNVLVTGGHYRDMTIDSRSSGGPTYDGRIKPELVAFGQEGTSDAAAVVSGAALLLQQCHRVRYGSVPKADLLKAALVVTADELGNDGPDYKTGFGAVNASKAIALISNGQFIVDSVQSNQLKQISINIPSGIQKLRVALNWIDPPAEAGDANALTNDLDLDIMNADGQKFLPWVLSAYPQVDSLLLPARHAEDHRGNLEVVSINQPLAGLHEISVKGTTLGTLVQKYAITYWLDTAKRFHWTYPTASDAVESSKETYLRWDNTYSGIGLLEVSVNGAPFEVVETAVQLAQGFYLWQAPPESGTATLRMRIGDAILEETTFVFSAEMSIEVEFNCEKNFLISWPQIPEAEQYQVFALSDKYLSRFAVTSDTSILITKDTGFESYYAVIPVIVGRSGYRSAAYNVNDQGVKCYYSNFYASATQAGQADLTLNLSTRYNIERITWQKNSNDIFENLGTTLFDGDLQSRFVDDKLNGGMTQYRALIFLKTGQEIVTDTAVVFYADQNTFEVFPNPIEKYTEDINVISKGNNTSMLFFDLTGRLVKHQDLTSVLARFRISDLSPGIYFYRIQKGNSLLHSGKIVLY